MKGLAIGLLVVAGLFLLFRDLPYLLTAQGHCMAWYQPSILFGFSPSFTTDLACIGVQ